MQNKRTEILNYIASHDRFSPLSLSSKFSAELQLTLSICEDVAKSQPDIQKWFKIICDSCGSTVTDNSIDKMGSIKHSTCEHCGNDFDVNEGHVAIYYKRM